MNKRINPLRPLIIPALAIGVIIILIAILKDIRPIDALIIGWIRHLPDWLQPVMTIVTTAGSSPFDAAVAIGWAAFEYRSHKTRRALVMLATLSAFPLYGALKLLVHRARPVTEYVRTHGLHDYSFPSGHTAGSATVYGMIAILAASALPRPYSRIVTWVALIFAFLVGVSRVYLGAHYPSDVLGGWLLALAIVSALRSISLASAANQGQRNLRDTTEEPQAE